ncbi:EthD domain-containing protein [Rhodococcus sp. T7]|uniref:EthD domain-containing protein n=1 Tax=Rhodococcus sp. T7 TaxID=627444 RepID=UPI00135B8110|nr:EthD domain-containing protein [Rhodococcus sp. T7]KAF0965655.1 hypothetical protein MLGJGCBP_01198 [Rhodococcus sp. T7]
MIKIVFCLRRRPGLSGEEFRRYWLGEHAELVRIHGSALRIRRYTQSHTIDDPPLSAAVDARGCTVEPYEGVAELWWDSIDDIVAAGSTPEGRAAGRALLSDEHHFIDLQNSAIFYAEEHVIFSD